MFKQLLVASLLLAVLQHPIFAQPGVRSVSGGGYQFNADAYKTDMDRQRANRSSASGSAYSGGYGWKSLRQEREERKRIKAEVAAQRAAWERHTSILEIGKRAEKMYAQYDELMQHCLRRRDFEGYLGLYGELTDSLLRMEARLDLLSEKEQPPFLQEERTEMLHPVMLALAETGRVEEALQFYHDRFLARPVNGGAPADGSLTLPVQGLRFHMYFKEGLGYEEDEALEDEAYCWADLALAEAIAMKGRPAEALAYVQAVTAFYPKEYWKESVLQENIASTYFMAGRRDTALAMMVKAAQGSGDIHASLLRKVAWYLKSGGVNPITDPGFLQLAAAGTGAKAADLVSDIKREFLEQQGDYNALLQFAQEERARENLPDSVYYREPRYYKVWTKELDYLLHQKDQAGAERLLRKVEAAKLISGRADSLKYEHSYVEFNQEKYRAPYDSDKSWSNKLKRNARERYLRMLGPRASLVYALMPPELFEHGEWDLLCRLITPYRDYFAAYTEEEVYNSVYFRRYRPEEPDRLKELQQHCGFTFSFAKKEPKF